jgi:hypothetical protein
MDIGSDNEAQEDFIDFSRHTALFASYDDQAVTPAQQDKKGKFKGAGGGG